MEVKNITQTVNNPPAYLERKVDPRTTKFMQALAEATPPQDLTNKKTAILPEPAAITRLVSPRSSMELKSLNPVETIYSPKPAAMEKIGKSRLVPFAMGSTHQGSSAN